MRKGWLLLHASCDFCCTILTYISLIFWMRHNGRSLYWASSIFITPKNEICFLRHEGVAPTWHCHALALLAPNSWDQELSADVKFSSVLWMVLSEYWKRLEKIFRFFGNENELSSSTVDIFAVQCGGHVWNLAVNWQKGEYFDSWTFCGFWDLENSIDVKLL